MNIPTSNGISLINVANDWVPSCLTHSVWSLILPNRGTISNTIYGTISTPSLSMIPALYCQGKKPTQNFGFHYWFSNFLHIFHIYSSSGLGHLYFKVKMSRACFFAAPIRPNLTTSTSILDPPARFLFFAPIAKYLDEIFPDPNDPEASILSPDISDTDWSGPVTGPFYVPVCC